MVKDGEIEMRILFAVPNYTGNKEPSQFEKNWQHRDWEPALQEMGHELVDFNWQTGSILNLSKWINEKRDSKNKELIELVESESKNEKLDLILVSSDQNRMLPETIKYIRKYGVTTVNFYTDDVNTFQRNEENAKLFDYNWTAQKSAIEKYKRIGANYVYAPLGSNPDIYKPYRVEERYDVSFVGRNMGYREELVQKMIDEEIDIKVWGEDWPYRGKHIIRHFAKILSHHKARETRKKISIPWWYVKNLSTLGSSFKPKLQFEEMIKTYSRSKINLNFAGGWGPTKSSFEKAVRAIKLRDFEVPMSGGFYLTEYFEELEDLYDIGKEIECFRTPEDLIHKIHYYLENPEERKSIAAAGRERALKDYTWKKSFETLFKEIGFG